MTIFLKWHLGLGDAIVCNGLVRELAKRHDEIILPCYEHNLNSVRTLFCDLFTVSVLPLRDEKEIHRIEGLPIGFYADPNMDKNNWDKEMYKHANVSFEKRWEAFHANENPLQQVLPPKDPYIFIHDDVKRNFKIEEKYLPKILQVHAWKTARITDWLLTLKNAQEIHCIDSSFLCLVDSLPLDGKKLVFHSYARNGLPPNLKKNWEIIRSTSSEPI